VFESWKDLDEFEKVYLDGRLGLARRQVRVGYFPDAGARLRGSRHGRS
jgi:hypothetical protein